MNILITGARSGLGYSYAKALAKKGHIVYAGVKTEEERLQLERRIAEEKVILFPIVLDLTKKKTYPDFSLLDLDVLILQASIGEGGSILELDKARLEENYQVNVFGNFSLLQQYLRFCYQEKKRGKVFLTSSLAAFLPLPYLSSYTSTKVSLYQLASTLKKELAYQNIPVQISVILPGSYATGFNEVMIQNKEKDFLILSKKGRRMSKYQSLFFLLTEKSQYDSLTKKLIKEVEKKKSSFHVSAPFFQVMGTRLYLLKKVIW